LTTCLPRLHNEWTVLRQSAVDAAWHHQGETPMNADARSLAECWSTTTLQSTSPLLIAQQAVCDCGFVQLDRPPCIQSWPDSHSQWLFSVPQSEVSPLWCPLSWRWSAQGGCQGVAGGTAEEFYFSGINSLPEKCRKCIKSVVIILKNKVHVCNISILLYGRVAKLFEHPSCVGI